MRIYYIIFSLNYNLQVMDEKIEKSQPFLKKNFYFKIIRKYLIFELFKHNL